MSVLGQNQTRLLFKRVWVRPFETKGSINLFGEDEPEESMKNVLLKKRTEFPKSLMEGLLWQSKGDINNFSVNIRTPKKGGDTNKTLINIINQKAIDFAKAHGYPVPQHLRKFAEGCTCLIPNPDANKICCCKTKKKMYEMKTTKPSGNVLIKAEVNKQSQDFVVQADKMTLVMEELDARKTQIDVFVRDVQGRIKLARTINVLESKGEKEPKKLSSLRESSLTLPAGDACLHKSSTSTGSHSPSSITIDSSRDVKSEGSAGKTGILKKELPVAISEPSFSSGVKKSRRIKSINSDQFNNVPGNEDKNAAAETGDADGLPKKVKIKGKKRYEKLKKENDDEKKSVNKEKRREKKAVKAGGKPSEEKIDGKIEKKRRRKKIQ